MNQDKLSTHNTIEDAHYGPPNRHPGPQILMDTGYDQ
jgi:hypothetical protein